MDPDRGYLGWLDASRTGRLPAQIWLAVVVDYCGNLGFIAVMKYVPALVVAACMLIGPFIASAEGMLIGVESLPRLWTIVGSGVIVCGSGIIATSEQSHSTTVEL